VICVKMWIYLYSRVTVVSKTFQNETDTVDKYYGTPYSIMKIPTETLNVIYIYIYLETIYYN